MLSKGKVKYIHSLEMKKYRNELNAFVAEGNKLVADMMFAFECELILAILDGDAGKHSGERTIGSGRG